MSRSAEFCGTMRCSASGSRIGAWSWGPLFVAGLVASEASGHHGEQLSPNSGDLRCRASWRISSRSRPSASISAEITSPGFPGERLGRGTEGLSPGPASLHSGHPRGIGPNREPGRILIPGDGAAGDQEAQNKPARQWRLHDACGLFRLNDLLALWSQAHMPSCNRQVTSTSVHMAKPGSASAPRAHAPQ